MEKRVIKYLVSILIILLFGASSYGTPEKRDSVVVSLITCWPGQEVYELCGHEALRVRGVMDGVRVDSVWNYGVFDFNQPNFIYRFVKGETDYMLAGYPFAWFLPEYQSKGRRVLEQDLNLTPDEARQLIEMLREEGLPENRTYRYNYVRDNCATRIVDRIDSVAGKKVIYPDNIKYGTFRRTMRAYHSGYPWYQFGIDLALGSGIDVPIGGREEMFVPVEMAEKATDAHFADGRPLIKESRVLNAGTGDATLPATPWWIGPTAVSWYLFTLVLIACAVMATRRILFRWIYSLWFGVIGLAGCLIAFLVFFSEHEATDSNVLILWLNPFQLLLAFSIWSRKMKWLSKYISIYNTVVIGCLLLVWYFQRQSANPAFFPLMGLTLLLSVTFLLTAGEYYGSNKTGSFSFNKKGNRRSGTPSSRPGTRKRKR
ncbi:MAG: DUF4105 domain-containing protein [Muribaculaceae bacterium]|nr:DUF4105 domain-containing protein [Muribaculaceae bacterium]